MRKVIAVSVAQRFSSNLSILHWRELVPRLTPKHELSIFSNECKIFYSGRLEIRLSLLAREFDDFDGRN